ncbi:MAG: helix-turn-helix transcriptional regulator [Lachnospiraceae bacterium]|nr:helix-turn-helix transcriptional regulator [Lachnospiraceae bacterium]
MISYAPFWTTLKEKGITQYQLINNYNFSTGTLDTLRKNNSITMKTLEDICIMLDCEIWDVVEIIKPEKNNE